MKKLRAWFLVLLFTLLVCGPMMHARADDSATTDTTAPVITLLGQPTVSIPEGSSYTDAGATALDSVDGDITSKIVVNDPVDTATPGTYTITYTVSDTAGNAATPVTRTVTVTPPAPSETVLVRNGSTIVYQGTIPLPGTGTVSITDDTGAIHSVNADSVLGLLYSISTNTGSFSLSDIEYYSSYNSLYLKCLTPQGGTSSCDNWQYVVNGTAPSEGMDVTVLTGGETVGLYFGSPHQVTFNTTSITAGNSFVATAEQYNYLSNTWSALSGVTIGATVPNPNDQYNPTVVTSEETDTNGNATLTLSTAGTYTIGIAEDYYFPAYTVTVTAPVVRQGNVRAAATIGGGGTPPPATAPSFSTPDALAYLEKSQSPDGSFQESAMYTDWAAIAFGAMNDTSDATTNLINYMSSHTEVSPILTDNERHAMALLALGQNPYAFHEANFIAPIINSFDGTQFGDPTLDNDDIFALIPLASAGYSTNDSIIAKDIAFVLSRQKSDGSWDESADMTAAGIQALESFSSADGAKDAIIKAVAYLQNTQESDGGFGNVDATSWAEQAMNAIGGNWTKNGKSLNDYLASQQASDGAALPLSETLENRIWATSYAIPAALGKPWSAIMQSVARPVLPITPPLPVAPVQVQTTGQTPTSIVVQQVPKQRNLPLTEQSSPPATEIPVTPMPIPQVKNIPAKSIKHGSLSITIIGIISTLSAIILLAA